MNISRYLTAQELMLAGAIAAMGFLFSGRQWLMFMDGLSPLQGLAVYYAILYAALFLLSQAGLIVWRIKIQSPVQILGMMMVVMAFFVTIEWESPYINYAVRGEMADVTNIYFQSEDGAMFYAWSHVVPATPENMETLKLLTYVVSPALLALGGLILVSKVQF